MTCVTSKHRRQNIQKETYSTIRVILRDLGGPGRGAITAVKNTTDRAHWWEEKSSVEDYVQYSMLRFKSVGFVLQACQSRDAA